MWPDLPIDPIDDLAEALLGLEQVRTESHFPGNILPRGISVQLEKISRIDCETRLVSEESFVDEPPSISPYRRCDVTQVIFGMVLHTPEDAPVVSNFRRLDRA